MTMMKIAPIVCILFGFLAKSVAFVSRQNSGWNLPQASSLSIGPNAPARALFAEPPSNDDDPVDRLSEERKANLFQYMLRDLQVEGVPLLGVDADQVHTLQAALWTTLAELSEQSSEQKACLIFEEIPISALRAFVDDFMILKTQKRLIESLPELERFTISLLGKGVGPALLIESDNKTDATSDMTPSEVDEDKCTAAMKMFVDRVVAGLQVCPYTKSNRMAPEGISNVQSGPIEYRSCALNEACHILSTFWNNICQLLATPADQLSTTIFSLPPSMDQTRFAAISELLSRSLCLYRGDSVFELLHFHPQYDRNLIHPVDKPAHGHLPPERWLRAMVRKDGKDADSLSDDDLRLSNYQRRSPVPAVCIKRIELIEAGVDEASGIVDLELEDGSVVKASGIPTYARNLFALKEQGDESLQKALDQEVAITK